MQLTLKRREIIPIIFQKDSQGKFVPFDITYCTYDGTRKTGGRIVTYKNCISLKDDYQEAIEKDNLVVVKTTENNTKKVYQHKKITIKLPSGQIKKLWFKFILGLNQYHVKP
jgi:hypothetical protein